MLIIVIENPIQLTIVKAVPLSFDGAFWATKVENKGESAITTIPQNSKKTINKFLFATWNRKGAAIQQIQDKNKKLKAVFLMPIFCEI